MASLRTVAPVEKLSINILSGVNELSSRAELKTLFERFGEVATCWLPPHSSRDDPEYRPFVKFLRTDAAQKAIDACTAGVVYMNDLKITAAWRQASTSRPDSREFEARGSNLMSSRDMHSNVDRTGGKNQDGRGEKDKRDQAKQHKSAPDKHRKSEKDDSCSSSGSMSEGSSRSRKRRKKEGKKQQEFVVAIPDESIGVALTSIIRRPLAQVATKVVVQQSKDAVRGTTLHKAVAAGKLKEVLVLLEKKADANETPSPGMSLLHIAAKKGLGAVCAALLKFRAAADGHPSDAYTPLHYGAGSGSAEVCIALLAAKASHDALHVKFGTPLHVAASSGSASCYKVLVRAGASLEVKDAGGKTPPDIMKVTQEENEQRRLQRQRRNKIGAGPGVVELGENETEEEEKRRLQRERRVKAKLGNLSKEAQSGRIVQLD